MNNQNCTCCDCEGCYPDDLNYCDWCHGICKNKNRIETYCKKIACNSNYYFYCKKDNGVCKDRKV